MFARLVTATLWSLIVIPSAFTDPASTQPAAEIKLRDCLIIESVGQYGRAAVHTDAIEALIVAGDWHAPNAGDTVTLANGSTKEWRAARAADDGSLADRALDGGYVYWPVEVPADGVMLLEAQGHSLVYVNGVPRAGDPYQNGWLRLPVPLKKGVNDLLFPCGRGRLSAKLAAPSSSLLLDTRDVTMPDLIVGEREPLWGAIIVVNAGTSWTDKLAIRAALPDSEPTTTPLPPLPPLGVRKVPFRFASVQPKGSESKELPLSIELGDATASPWRPQDKATVPINIRQPDQTHKRTFVSEIDGSVQYYAVVPPKPESKATDQPALFLTLHGASVEASGQAAAYSPKSWGYVVAATNRRPFGFDWEDWGRADAMEVLALAQQRFHTDPLRTYLTGHSMGGHGTWQVGVQFPDRFAAIAPSAGWISFWSYAGAARYEKATPIEKMLLRATSPSDTLALSRNYLHYGIYILHGDADDNVPVEQARTMRKHLAEFHADFAYYERPGAGHWWGGECVDWPPLFHFLKDHVKTPMADVRHVEFVTASPGVSATCDWASIEGQIEALKPSKIDMRLDTKERKFSGMTENVARLAIDLADLSRPQSREEKGEKVDATPLAAGRALSVELDGQLIEDIPWPSGEPRIWLKRSDDKWAVSETPSAGLKNPRRYGPFKEVFNNRFVLVVGTQGTPEENAWALAKARYDAETFQYRGNGSVDIQTDVMFSADADPNRNVIMYGNADTNAVWHMWQMLPTMSYVQVRRGAVRIGERELKGDNLATLFIQPHFCSDRALVAVIGGTGPAGMRLTDRLPLFLSGVAFPDCIVFGPEILTKGTAGIRVAGFFGNDWSVANGDFAWAENASPPATEPSDEE